MLSDFFILESQICIYWSKLTRMVWLSTFRLYIIYLSILYLYTGCFKKSTPQIAFHNFSPGTPRIKIWNDIESSQWTLKHQKTKLFEKVWMVKIKACFTRHAKLACPIFKYTIFKCMKRRPCIGYEAR